MLPTANVVRDAHPSLAELDFAKVQLCPKPSPGTARLPVFPHFGFSFATGALARRLRRLTSPGPGQAPGCYAMCDTAPHCVLDRTICFAVQACSLPAHSHDIIQ